KLLLCTNGFVGTVTAFKLIFCLCKGHFWVKDAREACFQRVYKLMFVLLITLYFFFGLPASLNQIRVEILSKDVLQIKYCGLQWISYGPTLAGFITESIHHRLHGSLVPLLVAPVKYRRYILKSFLI